MAYLTPGAMAILQARRQFNTGAGQAAPFKGTDPVPEPGTGHPPPQSIPSPPQPAPELARVNRIREWQRQNPERAANRNGLNPDGSINYDPSTAIGAWHIAQRNRDAKPMNTGGGQSNTGGGPNNTGPFTGVVGSGNNSGTAPDAFGTKTRRLGVI